MPDDRIDCPVRWGLLGCGGIAAKFAAALADSRTGVAAAVASRDLAKAEAFAAGHTPGAVAFGSYEELIAADGVEAVYVATPHPFHLKWVLAAIRAGKHVLVEKPAGMNQAEAMVMVDAARQAGVFFMEAFKDRPHPVYRELFARVEAGDLGRVHRIEAAFGFDFGEPDLRHRLFDPALGGGAILDIGTYAVSMARAIAGAAADPPARFADPQRVRGWIRPGGTGVDVEAGAELLFPGGLSASVYTTLEADAQWVRVRGASGTIEVPGPRPWHPDPADPGPALLLHGGGGTEEIRVPFDRHLMSYEADAAGEAIRAGRTEAAGRAMGHADTVGQAATLDRWLEQVDHGSSWDRPQRNPGSAEPLAGPIASASSLPTAEVQGVPVSRLVMGTGELPDEAVAWVLFDAYWRAGGRAFDTAPAYGPAEQRLGGWLRSRGVAGEAVVFTKGAHPPRVRPDQLREQAERSRERLGVDSIGVYLMHRDPGELPVGEWIDALAALGEAGLIRAAGASNWSLSRVEDANLYAAAAGRPGFSIVSNNLTLARMERPLWPGCRSSWPPAERAQLTRLGLSHLAWSAAARGYYTAAEGAGPDTRVHAAAPFDSPANRDRRTRARDLAERRGVSATVVALAWTLQQPFPSLAVIGPKRPGELRDSLDALSLGLSAEEARWLEHG